MKRILLLFICAFFIFSMLSACNQNKNGVNNTEDIIDDSLPKVEKWIAYEMEFTSYKLYSDAVYDCDLDVVFTNRNSGKSFTQPAFWDGDTTWKVRVALTELGEWSYITVCSDIENTGLHGITGKLNCIPYSGDLEIYKRGFLKTEKGIRYFMYDDGTPFFYLGDTHWTLPLEEIDGIGNITEEVAAEYGITSQFKYIMDYRAEQGYTVIQSQPLGWGNGVTGFSWFGDASGSIFEYGVNNDMLAKFKEFDRYFAYIAEKGFVHANSQFAYPEELIETYLSGGIDKENLEKLCRYWVARYSAYPVMWTTTQEGDNDFYERVGCTVSNNPWLLVMDYIDKYDAYDHPMSCHQENSGNTVVSNSSFGSKEAHDWYAAQYTIHLNPNYYPEFYVLEQYYETGKPIVNYEGRYDHFWTGTFGARAQGWIAFLNGNCGYGYGVQPIWSICWAAGEQTPGYDEAENYERDLNWVEGLYSDAGKQLIYMKDLLTEYEWYKLEPCFQSNEYYMPPGYTSNYSVAHIDNELYIAYFYARSPMLIGSSFTGMKKGTYEMIWLNCSTGERTVETVNVSGGKYELNHKPDRSDWVVVMQYKG